MATATEEAPVVDAPVHDDDEHHDHPKDKTYWIVGGVLALITALEVSTYFIVGDDPYGHELGGLIIASLLVMMVAKFFTIGAYFMHLKFDNPVFRWAFVSGLVLAIAVYLAVLSAFTFWDDGYAGEAALQLLS